MAVYLRRILMSIIGNRKLISACSFVCLLGMLLWARLIVTSNMPRTAVADDKKFNTDAQKMLPTLAPSSADNPRLNHMQGDVPLSPIRDPFLVSDRYFPKPTLVDVLKQDRAKLQDQEADFSQERKPNE